MITISWSEIDAWRQCPYKWRLAYAERWTEPTISPALAKGSLWHAILEVHYRVLRDTGSLGLAMDNVDKYLGAVGEHLGVDEEYIDLIRWMYTGYVQMWQSDNDWRVLDAELKMEVPLIEGLVNIKCRIDLSTEDRKGQYWLWDHKSGRNLPTKKETDLDDQFALYQWIINQYNPDMRVFGIIHNAARTQRNNSHQPLEERFTRIKMVRGDQELQTMVDEIRSTAMDIHAAYLNLDLAETMITPRHPDPDRCKWKCSFTSPCLLGRGTEPERVRIMLKDLEFRQDFTRH
jgi:RecB family exonuclease